MVAENPSYFYDILPYTYVLGVSKKWVEKFESLIYQPPNWYRGSNFHNYGSFGRTINSTIRNTSKSMTSVPSSSGSGGGSFHGGGHGGGGHSHGGGFR